MMFFLLHGYRVVAHDRRGHGRSAQVPDQIELYPVIEAREVGLAGTRAVTRPGSS